MKIVKIVTGGNNTDRTVEYTKECDINHAIDFLKRSFDPKYYTVEAGILYDANFWYKIYGENGLLSLEETNCAIGRKD